MFYEKGLGSLTLLAIHLTGIAIRVSLRGLLHTPDRRRAAEPVSERTRKRFGRAKANRQGNVQNLCLRLRCEPNRCDLDSPSPQIVANRFAHPRGKESVKVEWRKMCDFRQGVEVKWLIEMLINVCEHAMHSLFVF